jgi:hypothetical protein
METKFEKVAWDYYYSELTILEISKKYEISKNSVSFYKNKYPKIHFEIPEGAPIERVVVIDEAELERAEVLFKEFNIKYTIPFNFTLDMQFNSKIK